MFISISFVSLDVCELKIVFIKKKKTIYSWYKIPDVPNKKLIGILYHRMHILVNSIIY